MRPAPPTSLRPYLAAALVCGCATAVPDAPMRWTELGFKSAARSPIPVMARSELDRSTDALLAAIEASTGERPVFDGETFDLHPLSEATPGDAPHGWVTERRVLAMDILRDLERSRQDRAGLRRARAALRWDVALDADWSEVDARLVRDALSRADVWLGPPPSALEEPETRVVDAFGWPLHPVRITSGFGARLDPFGEGVRRHAGLDLSGAIGQPVTAAATGTVVYAGSRGAYGLHVELRHRNGVLTRYAHLSAVSVAPGEHIDGGTLIGLVGQSGRATGPHLHFEVWRNGLPVDPQVALPEEEVTERGTLPVATR